jgi:hypothetical protein
VDAHVAASGGHVVLERLLLVAVEDVTADLSRAPRATTTLYLVFKGSGTGALFDVDDFTFTTG